MEGTIKYVNPEQKYGYIKAEGEHEISFKMKEGREYPLNAHVSSSLRIPEDMRTILFFRNTAQGNTAN